MEHSVSEVQLGRIVAVRFGAKKHISRRAIRYVGLLSTLLGVLPSVAFAGIELVKGGSSRYCIYHAPDAPSSVRLAAKELETFLEKATGAALPVHSAASPPTCSLISLGDNAAWRATGLGQQDIPLNGYRIATRGNNLYVVGPDTPDGQKTLQGGNSVGTLNGVYTFLEEFVGVRWLMPGEVGEYVPRRTEIAVRNLDRIDRPVFASRRLEYVQNDHPLVKEWLRRQKQGYSLSLRHWHSWQYVIPASLYDEHPDWFPMINGVRPPPTGDRYKLETTNPELVQAFADNIIAEFNRRPDLYTNSISPTDSGYWSSSPESKALYDRDPHGQQSVTPLVLDFYSKVARSVARTFPDRKLCGYIYSDYLFPPSQGVPRLEPSLCLILAPQISYGYGLYRPSSKADWDYLLKIWPRTASTFGYYDLPVTFVQSLGAPNPPGLDLLKGIYPQLRSAGFQEVYVHGVSAWGHGAITNYLLAKLNWDPGANVDAVASEFFRLAYGSSAGRYIQQLYAGLDQATRQYYEVSGERDHVLTRKILESVYVPQLEQIESLYASAAAVPASNLQKARLGLFAQNLQEFYRYLKSEGLINKQRDSVFSEAISSELFVGSSGRQYDVSIAMAPVDMRSVVIKPVSVRRVAGASAVVAPKPRFLLRGKVRMLLVPRVTGEVSIRFPRLVTRGDQVRCFVHDVSGRQIAMAMLGEGDVIRFPGRQGEKYYLHILADTASFGLEVEGAAYALDSRIQDKGLHFLADYVPVYFYVPTSRDELTVGLSGWRAEGENAAADLVAPNGRVTGVIDLRNALAGRAKVPAGSAAGIWTIRLRKPTLASGDDLWVSVDQRLSPWVFLDPSDPILVEYQR